MHADVKPQFLLNPEMINPYIVQTVTEIIIKDKILAKNNQKKEKAERNKIYANKYKKRSTNSRFGRRDNKQQ